MLPSWIRQGKPVSIPLPNRSRLSLPLVPLIALTLGLLLLLRLYVFYPSHDSRGYTTLGFLIPPSKFLPPPWFDRPDSMPVPLAPKRSGMVVPNSLHYVYGLKPLSPGEQAEELPYYAYLAIRSAMIHLRPEKIYFHYQNKPRGPWWDILEPDLTLVLTDPPSVFMGRPITKYAHKADILRLLLMKHSGGIYLDIDMFVTKSFDDLMYFPTTLGMERKTWTDNELDPEGLCNAVIISAPNATFIDRWLTSYETFDSEGWAQHSVVKPWELARRNPSEIQVLNHYAFFWPMWHGEEIQYTHETNDYDFYKTGQYAYHAWESLAMKYLTALSPKSIRETDTSFHRLVRPFIGPKDDEIYRRWKGGK